jgi:hypothetical protein
MCLLFRGCENILNNTTQNKATLSGTNRIRENIEQQAKDEAERKSKEEVIERENERKYISYKG